MKTGNHRLTLAVSSKPTSSSYYSSLALFKLLQGTGALALPDMIAIVDGLLGRCFPEFPELALLRCSRFVVGAFCLAFDDEVTGKRYLCVCLSV